MSDRSVPNVVFILGDNVGWGDIGCYGGLAPTPRIDALAGQGLRFKNYNVEAQCTPTRSAHPDRPSAHSNRQLQRAAAGAGPLRARPLGVHSRRAVLRCRLRHRGLRQVARRRHRGPAADGSGLRRVVRHQEHLRRVRLQLLRPVRRIRLSRTEDLGGSERIAGHAGGGLQPGDAAAPRRTDRGAGRRFHQTKRRAPASRSSPISASRRCTRP